MDMSRRDLLSRSVLSVPALACARGETIHRWVVRVRRRRDLATHFARSAVTWREFARRSMELCRFLEGVDVEPGRREELSADITWFRSSADREAKLADHYARLAAFYRRAALRPWSALPP